MKRIILLLFLISIPFAEALEVGKAYIVSSINKNASESISAGESFSLVPQVIIATGNENYVGSVTKFTGCYGGKRYEEGVKTGNCLTGVVNSLNSDSTIDALSAAQGKVLNDKVTNLQSITRINYLRPTIQTQTINGVTITNNDDGTYTLNGTFTADEPAMVWMDDLSLEPYKDYKITGIPSGYGDQIELGLINDNFSWYDFDRGNGKVFNTRQWSHYRLRFDIFEGAVLDNITIKPMITNDLSATYDDFVSFDNSLVTGINSGLKLDLLWENTNPSASFSAQSINIDFSNYSCLLVKFSNPSTQIIMINTANYGLNVGNYSFTKGYTVTRDAVIKNHNEIYFGGASYQLEFGSDTKNDSYLIPHLIYGIK